MYDKQKIEMELNKDIVEDHHLDEKMNKLNHLVLLDDHEDQVVHLVVDMYKDLKLYVYSLRITFVVSKKDFNVFFYLLLYVCLLE
jgi:hypothetical protein